MNRLRLLLVEDDRLSAYRQSAGQLHLAAYFANDEQGWEAFASYLTQNSQAPHYLIANMADEHHIRENIPRLRGTDRQALIARRLAHHFQSKTLSTSTSLGQEASVPPRERLVISALTGIAKLEPWLRLLQTFTTPCDGVYTISQLGATLLRRLAYDVSNCLLLTQCGSSIRENYLRDGQLVFSRLVALSIGSPLEIASFYEHEAIKLEQYLVSQREMNRNQRLKVYMLLHPEILAGMTASRPTGDSLAFQVIDLHQAARQLKLNTLPSNNDANTIFLHLLLSNRPKQRFEPFESRRFVIISKLRQALWWFSLGMAVGLTGLVLYWQDQVQQFEMAATHQLLANTAQDLERPGTLLAITDQQRSTLRSLSDHYARLVHQQIEPQNAFHLISQALDQQPEIIVDEIQWQNNLVDSSPKNVENTVLKGSIEAAEVPSQRASMAAQERLIAALSQTPGTTVAVEQSAVVLESSQSVQHNTAASRFTLRITRHIPP